MALSGVHIACGYVGGAGQRLAIQSLARAPGSSQTMAIAGTSALAAPAFDGQHGAPSFEIRTFTVDIWFAIGPNPDATGGARLPLTVADGPRNVFCSPGDKIAWVAA